MFANEVQEWGERNLVYSKEITTAQSLTWPECLSGVFVKLWTSISRYTVHLHVADQRWWRWQILHVTCRQVTSITVRLDLCFVQWRTGGIYPFEKQDFFKRRNMQQLYVLVKNITANHQLQGVLCTLISDIKHKCFKASVWSMGEKKTTQVRYWPWWKYGWTILQISAVFKSCILAATKLQNFEFMAQVKNFQFGLQ